MTRNESCVLPESELIDGLESGNLHAKIIKTIGDAVPFCPEGRQVIIDFGRETAQARNCKIDSIIIPICHIVKPRAEQNIDTKDQAEAVRKIIGFTDGLFELMFKSSHSADNRRWGKFDEK